MANRIVSVHAGIYGMGIYAIMLRSSGFSVAHWRYKYPYVGRRPQFRLLAKYIHKTVRTDTDRARCDWLLLMIKY